MERIGKAIILPLETRKIIIQSYKNYRISMLPKLTYKIFLNFIYTIIIQRLDFTLIHFSTLDIHEIYNTIQPSTFLVATLYASEFKGIDYVEVFPTDDVLRFLNLLNI